MRIAILADIHYSSHEGRMEWHTEDLQYIQDGI